MLPFTLKFKYYINKVFLMFRLLFLITFILPVLNSCSSSDPGPRPGIFLYDISHQMVGRIIDSQSGNFQAKDILTIESSTSPGYFTSLQRDCSTNTFNFYFPENTLYSIAGGEVTLIQPSTLLHDLSVGDHFLTSVNLQSANSTTFFIVSIGSAEKTYTTDNITAYTKNDTYESHAGIFIAQTPPETPETIVGIDAMTKRNEDNHWYGIPTEPSWGGFFAQDNFGADQGSWSCS